MEHTRRNVYGVYMKHRKVVLLVCLFAVFGALIALQARGATYTWDGGGSTNNWSECANWTSDTCPTGSDIAKFDSSTTTDSVVDASFAGSVAGVDIDAGYTGTITQERDLTIGASDFNQADGTWRQGTTTFDINDGDFTLSGGTFTAATGTNTIERNVTRSGGTLTASSSRIFSLNSNSNSDAGTLSCSGDFGADILLDKTSLVATFSLGSGCEATTTATTASRAAAGTINGVLHLATTTNFISNAPSNMTLTVNGTMHAAGDVSVLNSDFTNNGTTTQDAGYSFSVEWDFAQNGHLDLNGNVLEFVGTNQDHTTLSCSGPFEETIYLNKSANFARFSLGSGCEATTTATTASRAAAGTINGVLHLATTTNFISNAPSNMTLTVNGTMHAAGDVSITDSDYTNNGTTTQDAGRSFSAQWDFAQNGYLDLNGNVIEFDGGNNDNTTLSCTGPLGEQIYINKSTEFGDFSLGSGCEATTTTSTSNGPITVNGTLATEGTTLTGSSLTIGSTGELRVHGDETITSPTLSSGSTVDYYGSGTYSSLIAGTDYEHLQFTGGGTYNIGNDVSVAGDLTSSGGSTFNQTSGTFTLDGGTQTVTGTSTFNNLTKSVTATNTVFFGANQEQTVNGTLTLQGDSDSTLYVKSTATGTQYKIDMQGFRTLEYLTISDGNNTNSAEAYCDTGCVNDGNNTNILFTSDPDNGKVYWDGGGGDDNWSTCANWKFDTCPDSTSVAAFDDRNVTNSDIDASFTGEVLGLSIESGYTGTISSNRSLTVGTDGFTLQDGTFTAPASTLTVEGDFTHTGGTFSDNSGEVKFVEDGTLTATANTALHDITLGSAPYSESLAAYWKFDEGSGSSAADSSGNGKTGTLQNMEDADWSTSDKASLSWETNAASLGTNASNEYVSVNVDLGSEWTIATWFKWPLDNHGGSWNTLTRGNNDHQVIVRRSDNIIGTYDNDGGASFVSSGYDMDNLSNGWHHLAAVGSGSQTEFYIDGTSVGTAGNKSTTDVIAVGNYQGGGQQWGRMDDFRIYAAALTESQIGTLVEGDPVSLGLAGNTIDIDGSIEILSGSTLDASTSGCSGGSCDIEVGGDWTNNGTFTPRSGTVTFDGSGQSLSGTTTFNNFTKSVSSPDTITFPADVTTTVSGLFTLKGISGNPLTATSSDAAQWKIDVADVGEDGTDIEYVVVNNSNNVSSGGDLYCSPGCVDGGNNTNWLFATPPWARQIYRLQDGVRLQGDIRFGGN